MKKEEDETTTERKIGTNSIKYFQDHVQVYQGSIRGENIENEAIDEDSIQKLNFNEINKQKASDILSPTKLKPKKY